MTSIPLVDNNGHDETWESQEKLWDALKKDQRLEDTFLDHTTIAKDGGLSEIGAKDELWYSTRYISSTILLLFVVYNILFLLRQDLPTILEESADYDHFLVSNTIADKLGMKLRAPQKVLAFLELCILLIPMSWAIRHLLTLLLFTGFHKWQAAAHLCWFTIPDLSCFSAIKVLQFVTPQQLMYDLNFIMWYEPAKTKNVKLIIWLIKTPLAWIIGLDSFLIKVRLANALIMDSQCTAHDLLGTIILLNQILGVVQIGKTIRSRLYRFVFAGEDGMMTEKESIRQDVWEAMIARRIFEKYPFSQACALILSWCDDDFQMMCLNETDEEDVLESAAPQKNHDDGSDGPLGGIPCLGRGGRRGGPMACW